MMIHAVIFVTLVGLSTADFDPELHAKYQTMAKSSFIEYFNEQNYSWKMAEYENTIEEKYTTCSHFDKESMEKLPVLTHNLEAIDLPVNFDARVNWPECESIKEIYSQDKCGSCWTFGTATTASDRTCIHKHIDVRLSEQDLECLPKDVCGGGDPYEGFIYWQNKGIVTQECKPYNITELYKNNCKTKCVNTNINYQEDKHFAEMVYRISNESDQIKAELVKNGPIQASFPIFEDFNGYKSEVYVHLQGVATGGHSVRIIGFGVQDGVDYWLVANSWGSDWGEHGFFRIKSYQEEIGFENHLVTGLPKN